jgi:hypothetical protein
MIKTWLQALLACALGVALGLLSDGARAAAFAGRGRPQAQPTRLRLARLALWQLT